MSNPFLILGLPISPAIDLAALEQLYTTATSQNHPDKFRAGSSESRQEAETRFMEINRAYQTLSDPKQRLLFLYEFATGTRPPDIQRIPPGTMDLFVEVGQFCKAVDEFFQRRASASGALAKAGFLREGLAFQDRLVSLRKKLVAWTDSLNREIADLEASWPTISNADELKSSLQKDQISKLEALYRKFSYVARWQHQLEEREVQIISEM